MTNRITIRIENTSTCMLQARIVPFLYIVLSSISLLARNTFFDITKNDKSYILALQCGCRFQ